MASFMGTAQAKEGDASVDTAHAAAAATAHTARDISLDRVSASESDSGDSSVEAASPISLRDSEDRASVVSTAPKTPETEAHDLEQTIGAAEGNAGAVLSGRATSTIYDLSSGETVTLREIDPLWGNIDPFYGDINPFYGDIDAFWGNINPFYGDINPFYGDIDAFYGDINPFYGDITAFWGTINPFYGDIVAFESQLSGFTMFWQGHYQSIDEVEARFQAIQFNSNGTIVRDGAPSLMMNALSAMIEEGRAQFGSAYEARTGQSFDVLVSQVFAKYGADPYNRASVEVLTQNQRARLYLDWHDALNLYSGLDAVDHWMPAINWTPAITQIQGGGSDTIIGIVDGSFTADTDLSNNIVYSGGFESTVGGHGAGVASLIAGAHDGEGVMGIAPNVNIATHNPFNSAGKTSWNHVLDGTHELLSLNLDDRTNHGRVSIVNLSLGVKGWALNQGMANLLQHDMLQPYLDSSIFVLAAGNGGITQTQDVDWNYEVDPTFILVGATNPAGEIARFSNRPGTACLLDNGVCHAGNELYRRTVVAPGMLLALADGNGGIQRKSGTSFAAPLVSGAISLLHDRWEWLAEHPEETAQIIFQTARDLGAPGPDEVYGWGMLDVAASQSPIDFNEMQFTFYGRIGSSLYTQNVSASQIVSMGLPQWWDTLDVYFTGFEQIGDTHRDFSIPASSFSFGNSTDALGRGSERFQDFVGQRFALWVQSGGSDSNGDGLPGFSEARTNNANVSAGWGLSYTAMAPQYDASGELRMVHGAATLTEPSGKLSFTFGHGQGAMALSGYRFGVQSDHDPMSGGVNPLLGFASGDSFMQAGFELAPGTKVNLGYSEDGGHWEDRVLAGGQDAALQQALGDRPASAITFDIEQRVSDTFTVNVQYTRLDETSALLGSQTSIDALLGGGAQSDALTFSASLAASSNLRFDVSATGARTATSRDQLFTSSSAIWSTSAQFTATKRGLFAADDMLRLTMAQPLQIEQGAVQFVADEVVNRETGEIGQVTQTLGIETRRRITTEATYALPLTRFSEFGAFGRFVSKGDMANDAGFVAGGNFSMRF